MRNGNCSSMEMPLQATFEEILCKYFSRRLSMKWSFREIPSTSLKILGMKRYEFHRNIEIYETKKDCAGLAIRNYTMWTKHSWPLVMNVSDQVVQHINLQRLVQIFELFVSVLHIFAFTKWFHKSPLLLAMFIQCCIWGTPLTLQRKRKGSMLCSVNRTPDQV